MRWKGRRVSSNVEDRRGGGGVKAGGISILGLIVAFVAWKFRLTNDTKCQFLRCMWLIFVCLVIKKAFLSEKGLNMRFSLRWI